MLTFSCDISPKPVYGADNITRSNPFAADELDDLGALRGNQQCKASGGDERHRPDQVQIHPGFSQNFETQLFIDHEGDQPGDEKISERMDKQGDGRGPWSGKRWSGKTERVEMVSRIAEVSSNVGR